MTYADLQEILGLLGKYLGVAPTFVKEENNVSYYRLGNFIVRLSFYEEFAEGLLETVKTLHISDSVKEVYYMNRLPLWSLDVYYGKKDVGRKLVLTNCNYDKLGNLVGIENTITKNILKTQLEVLKDGQSKLFPIFDGGKWIGKIIDKRYKEVSKRIEVIYGINGTGTLYGQVQIYPEGYRCRDNGVKFVVDLYNPKAKTLKDYYICTIDSELSGPEFNIFEMVRSEKAQRKFLDMIDSLLVQRVGSVNLMKAYFMF